MKSLMSLAAYGCMALAALPAFQAASLAEGPGVGGDPAQVIERVGQTYARVYSARGRIDKTLSFAGTEQNFYGRFAVKKPDSLLVELIGDIHQFSAYDGKTFRAYFPDQNEGIFYHIDDPNSMDHLAAGPTPFFGNLLPLMEQHFAFEVADTLGGNLILKAVPEKPLLFNVILIAIDPSTWTIRAVEHFDRNNQLVSQTRFLEFATLDDSLFFPTTVETSTVTENGILSETTRLSRVQLNAMIPADSFRIPDNDDTRWGPAPVEAPP